jgi:tRNA(Ile)-lysidine synthase
MWFLRGAGNKGLGGMSAVSPMSSDHDAAKLVLVRPLLEFSRAEILEYLDEIPYRLDPTNEDTGLLRNWIRRDLIPQLEKRMDPRLITRLAHQAEIFRDEEIVLQQLTQAQLDSIRLGKVLKRNLLVAQPRAMQRRIVRRWIAEHRGDLRRINFDHVEEFLDMIGAGPPQGRLSIPGGLELIKEYETLRLKQTSRNSKPIRYSYDFEIGTKLNVREAGMTISSELSPPPVSGRPTSLFEAIFDMADVLPTLTVRNFRHGDRFRPLGTDGQKKLKELFIEKKVPSSVRATLPLLAMGEEILWIPGYGRSEVAKVAPETKKILYLKAVPQNC